MTLQSAGVCPTCGKPPKAVICHRPYEVLDGDAGNPMPSFVFEPFATCAESHGWFECKYPTLADWQAAHPLHSADVEQLVAELQRRHAFSLLLLAPKDPHKGTSVAIRDGSWSHCAYLAQSFLSAGHPLAPVLAEVSERTRNMELSFTGGEYK